MRTAIIAVGVAAYVATGVVPYLGSSLVAPPAGVAFRGAAWIAGLVATVSSHAADRCGYSPHRRWPSASGQRS